MGVALETRGDETDGADALIGWVVRTLLAAVTTLRGAGVVASACVPL